MRGKKISVFIGLILLLIIGSFLIYKYKIKADSQKQVGKAVKPVEPEYADGEFIVKFKNTSDKALVSSKLPALNIKEVKLISTSSTFNNVFKIKIDASTIVTTPTAATKGTAQDLLTEQEKKIARNRTYMAILQSLRRSPEVESADLNYKRQASWDPDDPLYHGGYDYSHTGYDLMWGFKNIDMNSAWDLSKGTGINVAVLDTGIDYNHEDLAANIAKDSQGNILGHNFYNQLYSDPNDFMDRYGHGTHVAGTIGAVGNNGIGVIGVAPESKLMPVKVLSDWGSGWDDEIIAGITWAADNGAKVINMSFGGAGKNELLESALQYASSKGVVLVAAAGNATADATGFYPANSPDVIAIGSYDPWLWASNFSNFGPKVQVMAPGSDVVSTVSAVNQMSDRIVFDRYARLSGTSMASPHVAGYAALLKSKFPTWPQSDIANAIVQTAKDICQTGIDSRCGYGKIDPPSGLGLAAAYQMPTTRISLENNILRGKFEIKGEASGGIFQSYKLVAQKVNRSTYFADIEPEMTLSQSSKPVSGTLHKLDADKLPPGTYFLKLYVNGKNGTTSLAYTSFFNAKDEMPGYPVKLDYLQGYIEPVRGVLNGQQGEITVATTYNGITLLDKNNKELWTRYMGWYEEVLRSPLIADLNGDGNKEIVVFSTDTLLQQPIDSYQRITVFDFNGNELWNYKLQQISDSLYFPSIFMAEDVNRDGKYEVIVGEAERNTSRTPYFRLVAIDGMGKVLGKTNLVNNADGELAMGEIGSSDINRNGKKEIIITYSLSNWYTRKSQVFLKAIDFDKNKFKELWSRSFNPDSLGRLSFVSCPLGQAPQSISPVARPSTANLSARPVTEQLIVNTGYYNSLFSPEGTENYLYNINPENGRDVKKVSVGKVTSLGKSRPLQLNGENKLVVYKEIKSENGFFSQFQLFNHLLLPTTIFDGTLPGNYQLSNAYPLLAGNFDADRDIETIINDGFSNLSLLDSNRQNKYVTDSYNGRAIATKPSAGGRVNLLFQSEGSIFPSFEAIHAFALKTSQMPIWPSIDHDGQGTNSCSGN